MKFYKRFPGDIQIKTGHLSMSEFGAYDRLLDHYYATEQPLPADVDRCCSIARALTKDDRKAVQKVLAEFFVRTEAGWEQGRAEEMIAEAQPRIQAARANGKKGGRRKGKPSGSEKEPSGFPNGTQDESQTPDLAQASQSQIPDSSEANASDAAAAAAGPGKPPKSPEEQAKADLWRAAVAVLQEGGCKSEAVCRSFMGKLVGDYTVEVVRQAVAAAATAQPADAREYLKATCQRLKGERKEPVTVPSDAAEQTRKMLDAYEQTPEEKAAAAEAARRIREQRGLTKVAA